MTEEVKKFFKHKAQYVGFVALGFVIFIIILLSLISLNYPEFRALARSGFVLLPAILWILLGFHLMGIYTIFFEKILMDEDGGEWAPSYYFFISC